MLEGDQALYKVGPRLAERGLIAWLQPGRTRASLHDDRLGPRRDALLAAHRTPGLRAVARDALAVYAMPTPWRHQAPTTMALYGA
jgi:hypothetical protein